jgi:hypothetical protein
VPIHQRQNLVLVGNAALHFLRLVVADEGFIDLDHAAVRTERGKVARPHGLADAVRHEPRGFQGNAKGPVELVAADALLAGAKQNHRLKPNVHRDVAGLEDGPDLYGEGLTAVVALIDADAGALALQLGDPVQTAALGADRAMRPDARLNVGVGGFLVVKVRGAKAAGHGDFLLAHKVHHAT